MSSHLAWYVARSGGLLAWWLICASVLWGLMLSTRVMTGRPKPAWLLDIHRFLGGSAVLFTVLHVLGLVADTTVHFGPASVLVPFASSWHPVAVAWGVLSAYLLLAVEGTSLLMRRLPKKLWRKVHATSLLLFALSAVHALTAGTDRHNPLVQWSALGIGAAFVFLFLIRTLSPKRAAIRKRPRADPPPAEGLGHALGTGRPRSGAKLAAGR